MSLPDVLPDLLLIGTGATLVMDLGRCSGGVHSAFRRSTTRWSAAGSVT